PSPLRVPVLLRLRRRARRRGRLRLQPQLPPARAGRRRALPQGARQGAAARPRVRRTLPRRRARPRHGQQGSDRHLVPAGAGLRGQRSADRSTARADARRAGGRLPHRVARPERARLLRRPDEERRGTAVKPPDGFRFRFARRAADVAAVRALVAGTGFFNDDEVRIAAELVDERLARGPSSGYEFVLLDDPAGRLAGYTCWGPIDGTLASFDLFW